MGVFTWCNSNNDFISDWVARIWNESVEITVALCEGALNAAESKSKTLEANRCVDCYVQGFMNYVTEIEVGWCIDCTVIPNKTNKANDSNKILSEKDFDISPFVYAFSRPNLKFYFYVMILIFTNECHTCFTGRQCSFYESFHQITDSNFKSFV